MKNNTYNLDYKENREILKKFYQNNGLNSCFENDNQYLENSFEKIKNLWLENLEKIGRVNYIMIAEAPLWGSENKYIYNPRTNNSQFFYKGDLEDTLGIKIEDKLEFLKICNSIGLVILDISPFALNSKNTAINYRKMGIKKYKNLVENTLPYYFDKKIHFIKPKISGEVKVFFRYKRVKKNFEKVVVKTLLENKIVTSIDQISEISQKGGGINKSKLKEIISR